MDKVAGAPTAADMWWVQNHLNGGGDRTGNYLSTVIPFEMGGQLMFSNDSCTSTIYTFVPPVTTVPTPGNIYNEFPIFHVIMGLNYTLMFPGAGT